jgi:hypothetical protein
MPDQAEEGRRLATFPRDPTTELRVTLAEYQGHPYISLRVWERGRDGRWWPVKGKGCSVRIAEAEGLADALRKVGRQQPATERRERRDWKQEMSLFAGGDASDASGKFDEFNP